MIELKISFKHELYREYDEEAKRTVVYWKQPWMMGGSGSRKLYKNRIFVTGKDIGKIREVKYILHPTFLNPIRTVTDPTKEFELIFWAWGGFPMNIVVTDTDGDFHNYRHPIRLFDLVQKAEKDLKEYETPQYAL